jgi:tRNA A37 threonylcarbamoyltransferase TsaD
MLEGPYPGGKWIYDQASKFNFNTEEDISFPRIYLKKNEFNFSFS